MTLSHEIKVDPCLTKPDTQVLRRLLDERDNVQKQKSNGKQRTSKQNAVRQQVDLKSVGEIDGRKKGPVVTVKTLQDDGNSSSASDDLEEDDESSRIVTHLTAINNPKDAAFEPTLFLGFDYSSANVPAWLHHYIIAPYTAFARTAVRNETDVVMLTHLILYFTTSVPSALLLYRHFSWLHAVGHWLMQFYYVGSYTLMMHQHIHMSGILARKYAWFDTLFPYITDPLMGHTWNSYYYHHVKHHHVENNGPDDLSSTIRYQRDEFLEFLQYFGRFFLFCWAELPVYFLRRRKTELALKAMASEGGYFAIVFVLAKFVNFRATLSVFLVPLLLMRIGLMVGNWGQHAFVDDVDPNSDYRSSITLIDVSSNRYCFNDGYHTSHHLNPRRHWRDHPVAFLKQKEKYAAEQALVFTNIDYIMLTVKLFQKDYAHLAKCLVPIGDQIGMSLEEIAVMLRSKTRRFTEEEIAEKFAKAL